MRTRISLFLIPFIIMISGPAWSADGEDIRFAGDKPGRTDAFEMDGPWLLDWSARGNSKLPCNFEIWTGADSGGQPCNFEMRLLDVSTSNYVGTIAQLEGTGRGYKLFEQPGRFQIDVVAQNVVWELLITPIDEKTATGIKARTVHGASLEARSVATSRHVAEGAFSSWRPLDDETLLLFSEDETKGYRVTFSPACPGLSDATALSFVTVFDSGVESYDSVLLDDGTRCYFNQVVPTFFD